MSKAINDFLQRSESLKVMYNDASSPIAFVIGASMGLIATSSFLSSAPLIILIPTLSVGVIYTYSNINEYDNMADFILGAAIESIHVPTAFYTLCSLCITSTISEVFTSATNKLIVEDILPLLVKESENTTDGGELVWTTAAMHNEHNDIS